MITIGLTGGIGSGKSVVASVFEAMGCPCYDSDSAMKRLYISDARLKNDMISLFGHEIYTKDGVLDKKHLSDILFHEDEARQHLAQVAYPRLADDFRRWRSCQQSQCTLFESAILLSVELPVTFDRIIAVTAPSDMRIERVCKRSGITRGEVRSRMSAQMDDKAMTDKADTVIINDMQHPLIPQVLQFLSQFCQL